MEMWWDSLNTALKVFYAIAISTSALLVLQVVLMLFGLDADAEADLDAEGDGAGQILSVRSVTAFFTGFGWAGVAALRGGLSLPAAIAVAVLVGGVFLAGVVLLMRSLYSLRHSGTLDYRNAVGEIGSVYLPVPASMTGPGQVEVTVQGRLCVVQAFTRSPHALPNRTRVRVTEVMDRNTLIVEPLGAPVAGTEES